jgi:hypothetical protein
VTGSNHIRAGATAIRRVPLLRDLAVVIALATALAALVDYVLKPEAVAYFGEGEHSCGFSALSMPGRASPRFLCSR